MRHHGKGFSGRRKAGRADFRSSGDHETIGAFPGFDAVRTGIFRFTCCGESTALRLIAGLAEPSGGTIAWSGAAAEPPTRHDIGFVFQEPTLMPWATVAGNVAVPLRLRGTAASEAAPRIAAALDRVGLAPFRNAYP